MRRLFPIVLALALLSVLALPSPVPARAQEGDGLLRVMHAAPGAPAVDVYANGIPLFQDVTYFEVSTYFELPPAEYLIQVAAAETGLDETVISEEVTVNSGSAYTLVAVNDDGNLGYFLAEDNQVAPPSGEARLNLYHTVADAPAVDIRVAGTDILLAEGVAFQEAAALTVPAGTYELEVLPAGGDEVLYTSPALTLLSDWGYTLVATGSIAETGSFAIQSRVDYTSADELAAVQPPTSAQLLYSAELEPLNTNVTENAAGGTANFIIAGDTLTLGVTATGLYPEIMHLQHYHGFTDGREASCPPPEADTNGDGIIDLIETQEYTGITLVPLHANPVSLEIQNQTYPTAGEDGSYSYEQVVSASALEDALQSAHGIEELALERRTVFLHGINPDTELPESVQSLPGVPAHVTLPVACGELEWIR